MRRVMLLCVLLGLTAVSCTKEKLDKDSLSGKWVYSSVRYVRIVQDTILKDEVFAFDGYVDFTNGPPEESHGGTVYGDFTSGRAILPFIYGPNSVSPGKIYSLEGNILLGHNNKPKVSYKDKYSGWMLFHPDNISGYAVYLTHLSMLNSKTMTMRVQLNYDVLRDELTNENGFYVTLTRQ